MVIFQRGYRAPHHGRSKEWGDFLLSPYLKKVKACSRGSGILFSGTWLTEKNISCGQVTTKAWFPVIYTSFGILEARYQPVAATHWGIRIPCAWPATATRNLWRHHPAHLQWRLPTPCCPATAFAGSPHVARHRVLRSTESTKVGMFSGWEAAALWDSSVLWLVAGVAGSGWWCW
jgi:hypothetical protein